MTVLANRAEVNITMLSKRIHNYLVDARALRQNDGSIFDAKARVYIKDGHASFLFDRGYQQIASTVTERHGLDAVSEEGNLVQQLVLLFVEKIDDCIASPVDFTLSRG